MTKTIYKVVWEYVTNTDLKFLTHVLASKIKNKINNYLAQNPRELGRQLTGSYSGLYRYRYGDYRIIYKILEEENTIVILRIGHRKNIY